MTDLIDVALCRNPITAASWAGVRVAAANIGVARGNYYPQITVGAGPQLNRNRYFNPNNIGGSTTTTSLNSTANIAIDYLLFDFGGRSAEVDAARASERVALANYADSAQSVVFNTIAAYNALQAAIAAEAATEANVAYLKNSLDNARGRMRAGVTTPADSLQAETAYEQARFTLVQAQGNTQVARGQLAVAVGLLPQTPLQLAPTPPLASVDMLGRNIDSLLDEAQRLRPDIAAARAQSAVAEANVRSAQALSKPSISTSASSGASYADTQRDSVTTAVGISLTVPLFTGYRYAYQVTAARAALDQANAQTKVTEQSAALDVWNNRSALETQLKSLSSARALIRSAQASADIAQGRFKAGVGTITDTLNAASALATARQQLVAAEYGVRDAQAGLAKSIGALGETVDSMRTR
ncbi:TolC family protein [Polymorphobacter arshaanensis]|uniref:TolC family protein n=1 Tax=Glacieibacterium arshaanense TaxID=2511025 RepID=UPI00140D2868|nr:TolC family protein [Polymorphobacter arshaanensis]